MRFASRRHCCRSFLKSGGMWDVGWKPYADTVLAMYSNTLQLPQQRPTFDGAPGTKTSSLCKGVP